LNELSQNRLKSLLSFVRNNVHVIALMKTLASWDYEIDLEVNGPAELKKFTMEITTQFSDLIKNYETLQIEKMPKYNFFIPN